MLIRKALVIVLLCGVIPAKSQTTGGEINSTESDSAAMAFRNLLLSTVITEAYLAPYSFMYGVVTGGNVLTSRHSPKKATATWAGVSLTGLALGWLITDQIAKDYLEILKSGSQDRVHGTFRFYRILFAGASTASILDFQGESVFEGNDGSPLWTAATPEVKTVMTFPTLGYGLGASGRRWGGEFEIALVSHHTRKQTIPYDAEGMIYVPDLKTYVPIQLDQIEIPDRFLMLHSLSMGANFYVWLPTVVIHPYIGLGAQLLLNSVQSQYPGPANLTLETGELALDSITLGMGLNALVGFRIMLSDNKFLFTELRPVRHYFSYESGSGQLREDDRFNLQIFQFRIGLGHFFL